MNSGGSSFLPSGAWCGTINRLKFERGSIVEEGENRQRTAGTICALLFLAVMAGAAQLSGERELLFPEAAALAVGAWIAPQHPWRVRRKQLAAVMTMGALGGVAIVRWLPGPLVGQVAAGLVLAAVLLTAFGVTLMPLISACVLPIYLGTQSWLYPAAVLALTLCLALGQWWLERRGLRKPKPAAPPPALGVRVRHWAKTFAALALFCLPAAWLGLPYLAAPPLLVTFAELFFPHSPLRQKPLRVLGLLAAGVWLGFALRLLQANLGLPLVLCAMLGLAGLLPLYRKAEMLLPPAAAAALLPLLLPTENLWRYPVLATLGAALVVGVPCLVYRRRPPAPASK